MKKLLQNKNILLCGLIPSFPVEDVDFEKYKEARGLFIKDPWERVKSIFRVDNFGNLHPELQNAIQMAQGGMLVGVLVGGFIEVVKHTDDFMRTNDTTIYFNNRYGIKDLVNKNMLAAAKGSLKWSPSIGLFCGTYSLVSSCCELYRNKFGIFENVVAGSVVGALSRFMFGIRGMISGGIVGGVVGTTYGGALWIIKKLGKTDDLEIKYVQFAFAEYRKQLKNYTHASNDKEFQQLLKSGVHKRHVPDPLNELDSKMEEIKEKMK